MACAPGINHKGLNKQIKSFDSTIAYLAKIFLQSENGNVYVFELYFYEVDIIEILTCWDASAFADSAILV